MNNSNIAIQNANDYYIHYNKSNIGTAKGGSSSLSQKWNDQRQVITAQVASEYIKIFDANINNNSIKVLASAMDLTEEEFLTVLNTEIANKLQNQLSIDKLQVLYTTTKNTNISKFLANAVEKKSIEDLGKAFKGISKALSLLDGRTTEGLGAVLLNSLNGDPVSFKEVGEKLAEELKKYKISENFRLIKRQSLQVAKNQLESLAYVLQEGKFKKSGKDLTPKGLSTLLLNGLISTQIAQGLAFSMYSKANSLLYKTVLEIVGTQTVDVESDFDQNDTKITGKTDVKAENVSISLQGVDKGEFAGEIKLNIGISSKFYTGKSFNKDLLKPVGVYGSGSGGTLSQAIQAIWGNANDRYLVYNYFSHNEHQEQLKNLIATRQIIRLFSTAGSNLDFANFMLVNGRIISMWEIVKYVISSKFNLSDSDEKGISLSIPSVKKGYIAAKNKFIPSENGEDRWIKAWERSRKVNKEINQARIYADLHLKNLINANQNL